MTLEQLAADYKQLLSVTNSLANCLQGIEIIEQHPGDRKERFWSNHNCWLYKNNALGMMSTVELESAVEKYNNIRAIINSNQELKMLVQGVEIKTINATENETQHRHNDDDGGSSQGLLEDYR